MILTALFTVLAGFIKLINDTFLSEGSGGPAEFTEAMEYVFSQARGLDTVFPIHEALEIFRWGILIFFTFFFYTVGVSIYNKFRGI